MKRYGWWGLGIGLSAALMGCDDESSGGGNNNDADSGVPTVIDLSDKVDDIEDRLDGIDEDLDGIGGRLDDLETPGSCSAGELCIPDGLDIALSGFETIVRALCEHEIKCCDADELKYRFGATIKNADECVATFTNYMRRGYSPDFLNAGEVREIVEVAHALNNTNVQVAIDPAAVKACADSLASVSCTYEEGDGNDRCRTEDYEEYGPCSIAKLLKGQEREGDLCDPSGVVNECGEGLVCVPADDDGCWDEGPVLAVSTGPCSQAGICVRQPSEGDRCLEDWECGDLFCNQATGKCQARAKNGETCAYVDPTFEHLRMAYWYVGNNMDYYTKIDCEAGSTCDPVSKKCVSSCTEGAFCNQHRDCPEGLVCSYIATDAYRAVGYGQCVPPSGAGEPCKLSWYNGTENECESGMCSYDAEDGRYECAKSAGEACTTAGADSSCASGWCGTDLKCAAICNISCEGDDCLTCPSSQYCDTQQSAGNNRAVCKPLIANGNACDQTTADQHASCQSGFCDLASTNTCQPKVANNAACPSGYDEQCQAGQFCNQNGNCATAKAIGAACTPASDECGDEAFCHDTKDLGNAADYKCYARDRDLPDGSACFYDSWCVNGWCKDGVCAPRLALGANCDVEDSTLDHCVEGAFCAYGEESTAGKCQALGKVGQACDPRYYGEDCYSGDCDLVRDSWLCDRESLPPDAQYCDGE